MQYLIEVLDDPMDSPVPARITAAFFLAAVVVLSTKMPRRSAVYYLMSSWGELAILGVMLAAVGRTVPLVSIGVPLMLPGLLLLPRRLQVRDGVLITRQPFLMTRRAVDLASISRLEVRNPLEWGGRVGTYGVSAILTDGRVVPVTESMSFTRRRASRWLPFLEAILATQATSKS
jgi:hypothetical protein